MDQKTIKATKAAQDAALRELKAMSRSQLKALQSKIGVSPDGRAGAGTAARLVTFRAEQAEKKRADADIAQAQAQKKQALADAQAAKAKAEAARAQAEAQRITAKAAADKAKAEAESKALAFKREQERAARKSTEATVGGVATITAATAGVTIGKKVIAKTLDQRFATSVDNNRAQVAALAKEARSAMKSYARKGSNKPVIAARMLEMGRAQKSMLPAARSPLGIGIAAAAGGLGAFSLYRGSQESEFVSKMAFNTMAGLELGVAVGTVGQQLANRSNPTTVVPAKDIADIKAAERIGKERPHTRSQKNISKVAGRASTLGRAAPYLGPAIGIGVAGLALTQGSTPTQAAKLGADVASAGSISEYEAFRARGNNMAISGAMAALNFATFGLFSQARADNVDRSAIRSRGQRLAQQRSRMAALKSQALAEARKRGKLTSGDLSRSIQRSAQEVQKNTGFVAAHNKRVGNKTIRIERRRKTAAEMLRGRGL